MSHLKQRALLCAERTKIETEQLPFCHLFERKKKLEYRLQQIEHEIKGTYEAESYDKSLIED